MRKLFIFLIASACGAATLPLYIDTDTNTVVSPDAPTTLAGYGITDGATLPIEWSSIANTPTTIAGYGITDALQSSDIGTTVQAWNSILEGISDGDAAIGTGASAPNGGGAAGNGATTTNGGAVGKDASAALGGGAVGNGAEAWNGFAGGVNAKAEGLGRVQLGTGTNSTNDTIQFLDSGSVTAEQFGRLAVSTTAATGSTYTVLSTDQIVLANNSGGVAVALISAASAGDGFRLVVKNTGTGAVTIDADGTETIDGALTAILTNQYESITIVSDGSNWFIL